MRNLGRLFAVLVLALLGAGSARAAGPEAKAQAAALTREANEIYAGRTAKDLQTALAKLEAAVKVCPDCPESWLLLSEVRWGIGERLPRDQKEARLNWFVSGEQAADRALALVPDSGPALYWKTVNMASGADMKGWASSLWLFPTLLKNMETVEAKAPHYYYGGTDRFWTEVLVRVPLFLADRFGYKAEDLAQNLEDEIKLEPRFFSNYVFAARLYWKMGEKEKALARLYWVLSHDPAALPNMRGDNFDQQAAARRMWKEYTGKNYPQR